MTTTNYATEDYNDETAEAAENREVRATLVENLRAYADLLEQHPDLPAPGSVHLTAYVDADTARAGRKGIPGWEKYNTPTSYYVSYSKVIGSGNDYRSDVHVAIEVSKEDTCKRVQVSTRHVPEQPAVEAHDEPVYAWKCQSGPGDDSETE